MQQCKYYLDPKISLMSLSRHIGTNRSYLSLAIFYGYGCNFCTYINNLRIKELIDNGDDALQSKQSFYNTAWNCGFNSKRTLDRAFLKEKGLLPVDFVAQQKRVPLQNQKKQLCNLL